MSPQQVKILLEGSKNGKRKKEQEKMMAQKVKGTRIKNERRLWLNTR